MYKIKAGDSLIYDSTNKYDYPCTEPTLNLELGEAGNLEFTLLPGHPLHDAIEEMQTFVTAYQDDDILLDGRVLQAEEDTFGQVRCTCEGALTFLLDSEMEPETYTETIQEFFARCINEHNKQVEARKHFSIGNVDHEEKDVKLEFKLEGYNKTREVLNNLLISKHGGFLQVRYENGQRYLDYIQHYTKTTNQPIKIGYNVIDKTKHVSGENLFTILRPLGKNNLTIEGASSENLMEGASIVSGSYLDETGGDRVIPNNDWMYSANFISVSPGATYIYGPGEMRILCYDEDEHYMTTLEPGNAYEVTIPLTVEGFENEIAYVRLAYNKAYNSKIVFKELGSSLISGSSGVQGKILTYTDSGIDNPDYDAEDSAYDAWDNYEELEPVEIILQNRERVQDAEGWNYDSTIFSVSVGSQYLATPGLVSANFYKPDKDGNYECFDMYRSTDNIGGDIFTVPAEASGMRLSYSNRFGSAMRVELYSGDNLASRSSGTSGKLIGCKKDKEEDDGAWCYTSNYIEVEENTYYTGGPSQIKVCFYDENKYLISVEEANREGLTMHYVRSPQGAKYARISFLAQYASEQQFQKGKALILTKLDKGTKTILLPERIARYGQIIHTENFSEITDAQELYNAAIEWVSLHHSMLPASLDYSIVDFHLLNPEIEMFELGDVYDNIEGFEDEAMTIGSLSKNMENPANDTLTLKNLAELMGPDAGKSSGSLSSKYAASSSGGGSGGNGGGSGGSNEEEEETIPKEILIKALESIGIEAPYIRLLAEERDGLKAQIDLIAKGKDGNQSSISLTDSAVDINSENIILEAKNLYNIADHVVTIADTVFTHANLIWNEAKDIVTIAENMYILTDHLTVVADTIDIIANDINILARNIRITMHGIEGLRAYLELTASHLRAEFYDDLNSLRSYFELTASHLRTEFYDDLNSLRSYFELTASHLRTEFYDDLNSLRSYFELTASHLRTEFYDDLNSLRSYLELTASHLRTEFADDVNSLRSEFELTASHLRTEFADDVNSLRSEFELTASHLRTEFADDVNSLRSEFELTASHLRVEFEDDTSSIRSSLIAMNDLIDAKVGRSEVTITDDSITIGSQSISLEGYVTVEKLETEIVQLDHVVGSFDVMGSLSVGGTLGAGAIESEGQISASSISLNGYTLTGSMVQDMDDAVNGFGNGTSSGGVVSIPYTTIGGGSGTITFNMADTQWYADQVSALTPASATAYADTNIGSRYSTGTVAVTLGNGDSVTLQNVSIHTGVAYDAGEASVTLSQGTPSGGSVRVTASNGEYEDVDWRTADRISGITLSSSDTGVSTKTVNVHYNNGDSTTGLSVSVDASAVYAEGLANGTGTPRSVSSVNTIGLSRSDVGTSINKTTTISYSDGASGTITVPINTMLVYLEGVDDGEASVVQRSVSSIDAITLSGDHTSGNSVSITGTYTDGNSFASSVSIATNAIALKYYNMGYERAWGIACNCVSINDNKISGPDPSSPGNSMVYYTVSAGAAATSSIYWQGPNYARVDFKGIARVNGNSVAEAAGTAANAMPT
jgi:hypothetical protein